MTPGIHVIGSIFLCSDLASYDIPALQLCIGTIE